MKRIFFLLALVISIGATAQVENNIYGKDVVIRTRDTSAAELTIRNSTKAVAGYLKNIGSGKTSFVLPSWSEIVSKPTTFTPSAHTHGNADITDLAWTKLTGVPDLVLVTRMIDSLALLQGRINTKLNIADAASIYMPIARALDSIGALRSHTNTKENVIAAGTNSQYWRGDKSWQTLDKAAVGLSNVPNTDATNASNISSGTLADARLTANVTLQGNTFNGASQLVQLDESGKLPTSTIPFLAITEPFVVTSQAAMLALTAQTGDVAVRTDEQKTYILAAEPASTLSNWIWLPSPDSESDPVYTASSWYSTTNNSGNWNTAYSWGNHASAGYASASRTITINGTTYDLTANRSWTVGDVRTDGSYSNPAWITSLAGSKISGNISGNAATATNATQWNGELFDNASLNASLSYLIGYNSTTGKWAPMNASITQSFLGLGTAAYTASTAYIKTDGTQGSLPNYTTPSAVVTYNTSNGNILYSTWSQVQTALGLGSNAYTSTSFLPLTAGSGNPLSGDLYAPSIQINGYDLSKKLYVGGNVRFDGEFLVNGNITSNVSGGGAIVIKGASQDGLIYTNLNTLRFSNSGGTNGFYTDLNSGAITQLGTGALTWNGDIFNNAGLSGSIWSRYGVGSNLYAASLTWNALQLGNNGPNYIVAGNNASAGDLRFYVNNTTRVTNGTAPDGILSLYLAPDGAASFYDDVSITGNLQLNVNNWVISSDSRQRFYPLNNSHTYVKGSNVIIRDNADNDIATFAAGSGNLSITGAYTGLGTGLTGTASGLNIGGNAATSSNSSLWNGQAYSGSLASTVTYLLVYDNPNGQYRPSTASSVQTFLGLGSSAYLGISSDTELGYYFPSVGGGAYGYLKTAAFRDANQDLETTSNVTFNQVNATITGSVGTDMGTGGILSGTPRVIRYNIGGTYYYVTAYPIFSPPQP